MDTTRRPPRARPGNDEIPAAGADWGDRAARAWEKMEKAGPAFVVTPEGVLPRQQQQQQQQQAILPSLEKRLAGIPEERRDDISFADLVAHRETLVEAGKLEKSRHANEMSALTRFCECLGIPRDGRLVPVFTDSFDDSIRRFETAVAAKAGAPGALTLASARQYASRLRNLHEAALVLCEEPLAFSETLDAAARRWVAEDPARTVRDLCSRCGIPEALLDRWRCPGACPRATAATYERLGTLETVLGLPEGDLSSRVVDKRTGAADRREREARRDDPDRMPSYSRIRLCPKMDALPETLRKFFSAAETYKTARLPGRNLAGVPLKRSIRAREGTDGGISPWSQMFRSRALGMLGWLALPDTEDGAREYIVTNAMGKRLSRRQLEKLVPFYIGKGLRLADLTPGHLVDPLLVSDFLDWKKARGGGSESRFHVNFAETVKSLVDPVHGFLTQQPEFLWDYLGQTPVDTRRPGWREEYDLSLKRCRDQCAAWREELQGITRGLNRHAKLRNPKKDLAPIVESDDPMAFVIDVIKANGRSRPRGSLHGTGQRRKTLALWFRDQLLLRLVTSNPLREKNLRQMTWRRDDSGNLYRDNKNKWRLRFKSTDFKNEKGAAREDYDVAVSDGLQELVTEYMEGARKVLLGKGESDAVFLTKFGSHFNKQGISNRFNKLALPYLKKNGIDVRGLRSHAWRHIVATSWLKAMPGEFRTVAHILHDTLETVLRNYDQTSPDDGLTRYDRWLLPRMPPVPPS